MGHAQRSNRAQLLPKRKPNTRNEVKQLREENRQLRELVAHLSKLAIARIAGAAESEEEQAG
jgi:cell shape-determining protein MreC